MKKALLALLLAAVMTASACGGGSETTDTGNADNAAAETTEAVTTTEKPYLDDLPSDLNYDGASVNYLYRAEVGDEFYVEEADGDIVHDALFESMRSVEERLNVDIAVTLRDGHLVAARNEYMNHISNTIIAGDALYDWVDLMIGNSPVRAKEGIFMNVLDNKMIDLSKPWYIPDMEHTASILDQLYFISGDASLGYLKCVFTMYFNQTIADAYGVDDIYGTVENGQWTIEKLKEYAKLTAQDVNNDGVYDLNDKLGFVCHDSNHPKGFLYSCGSTVFTEQDGDWTFTFGSDRDFSMATELFSLKKETEGSFFYNGTNAVTDNLGDYAKISSKFCNDEIFIISAEMDDVVSQFRSMESPYGILPYPKYDEAQDAYISASRNTHNAFSMPITCTDPDMAGAVHEALSASNYKSVLPTYFEVALKVKYSADDKMSKMFDTIHGSMILDFGYTYGNALGSVTDKMSSAIFNDPGQLASSIASNTTVFNTSYEAYVETIEGILAAQ